MSRSPRRSSTAAEPGFINATLDACAKDLRGVEAPMNAPADEFDIIRDLFAPLATDAGARGLIDDAAVLETRGPLVVTTDAIVEGVHFLADDPIDTIAKKALRVNLSDLAGKGRAARRRAVDADLARRIAPPPQIADFARGLGEDLQHYGVALWSAATPPRRRAR